MNWPTNQKTPSPPHKSAKKFVADKGFEGTQGGQTAGRSGPVQFEKAAGKPAVPVSDDPFGLDAFLDKAKKDSGPASKRAKY